MRFAAPAHAGSMSLDRWPLSTISSTTAPAPPDARVIAVRGAREHNLKNVDLIIPRDKLVVFTGLSGSGKSSLAFDTIYAEGQRRYVEIAVGLCAPVSGDDAEAGRRPDRRPVARHLDRAEDHLAEPALDGRHRHRDLRLHAPALGARRHPLLARDRPADREPDVSARWSTGCWRCRRRRGSTCWRPWCAAARASTARRSPSSRRRASSALKIDGEFYAIDDAPTLDKKFKHDIDVVVDRIVVRPDIGARLAESFETALELADGIAVVELRRDENGPKRARPQPHRLLVEIRLPGLRLHDPRDRAAAVLVQQPVRRLPDLRRHRPRDAHRRRRSSCRTRPLTLKRGAIAPWAKSTSPYYGQTLEAIARHYTALDHDQVGRPAREGARR